MSSAMGYQPTLSTDMGSLQEQITSTKEGFTTSIQAVYVPADDLTNPALAMTFAHLDATTVLSRGLAAKVSPFLRLVDPDLTLSPTIMAMIESASEGLLEGKIPIRTQDGSGGAYFMLHPSGETTVAVFKPQDEERNAVNNHQGQLSRSDSERRLKRGTTVGEGALREVAAYLLDHPRIKPRADGDIGPGFSGVPPTVMVECLHKSFHHPDGFDGGQQNIKVGSLQVFMPSDGSCDNWGSNGFPVDEVHKIAVLDLRTANADRHAGNILFRRGKDYSYELIPIDHGYSLPESFEDLTFEWLNWRQSHEPFSADTLEYIRSLDAEQDIALLRSKGLDLPHLSARTLRISTMILKEGANRGLSPYDIGGILCREIYNKESVIEKILEEAYNLKPPGTDEAEILKTVSGLLDVELDKVSKKPL